MCAPHICSFTVLINSKKLISMLISTDVQLVFSLTPVQLEDYFNVLSLHPPSHLKHSHRRAAATARSGAKGAIEPYRKEYLSVAHLSRAACATFANGASRGSRRVRPRAAPAANSNAPRRLGTARRSGAAGARQAHTGAGGSDVSTGVSRGPSAKTNPAGRSGIARRARISISSRLQTGALGDRKGRRLKAAKSSPDCANKKPARRLRRSSPAAAVT